MKDHQRRSSPKEPVPIARPWVLRRCSNKSALAKMQLQKLQGRSQRPPACCSISVCSCGSVAGCSSTQLVEEFQTADVDPRLFKQLLKEAAGKDPARNEWVLRQSWARDN